jgi:ADP-ribose pyrophosphatase YjhB (NUDIX family)
MNFCSNCGAAVTLQIPEGDDRARFVCGSCGTVHYENPKVVVGCIAEQDGRILLCRRNISPQKGKWTIPAGYLENNESLKQGALRETLEEAGATVAQARPYRLFDLPFISQIYIIFRARLQTVDFTPTPESAEIKLFKQNQIPWDVIAFQVIAETLRHYFEDRPLAAFELRQIELAKSSDISPAKNDTPDNV